MPGPAFQTGDTVSLHPIEEEDYEFVQRGRNDPSTRVPLADTTIRTRADVEEMLSGSEYHFLVCMADQREATERASVRELHDDSRSSEDAQRLPSAPERRSHSGDSPSEASGASENGETASSPPADTGDAERVGVVSLGYHREGEFASLMYWVAPEHRRQGYVSDALELFLDYVFDECGFHKATARVMASNEASAGVLEKLGFEREGEFAEQRFVDGEWVDAYQYGLLAHDWSDD